MGNADRLGCLSQAGRWWDSLPFHWGKAVGVQLVFPGAAQQELSIWEQGSSLQGFHVLHCALPSEGVGKGSASTENFLLGLK